MNIQISRLDYKNATSRSAHTLPTLTNVNEITDVNEVDRITLHFHTKDEADKVCAMIPKSFGGKVSNCSGSYNEFKGSWFIISFRFNTVFTNKSTGDINEAAAAKRNKVISKLKSIS